MKATPLAEYRDTDVVQSPDSLQHSYPELPPSILLSLFVGLTPKYTSVPYWQQASAMVDPTEVELLRAREPSTGMQTPRRSHFSSNRNAVQSLQSKQFMRPLLQELIEQTLASIRGLASRTQRMGLCRQKRKIIFRKRLLGNQAQICSICIVHSVRESSA